MKSIVEQVLAYGESQPDKIALSDGKTDKTYRQLQGNIYHAQTVLIERYGLKKAGEFEALLFLRAFSLAAIKFFSLPEERNCRRKRKNFF